MKQSSGTQSGAAFSTFEEKSGRAFRRGRRSIKFLQETFGVEAPYQSICWFLLEDLEAADAKLRRVNPRFRHLSLKETELALMRLERKLKIDHSFQRRERERNSFRNDPSGHGSLACFLACLCTERLREATKALPR